MSTVNPHPGERLTPVERNVMKLVCKGYTNQEIAQARGVSWGTVKMQMQTILVKLNARDRTHAAVLFTLQEGG